MVITMFLTWRHDSAASNQETPQHWSLLQHNTECGGLGQQTSVHNTCNPDSCMVLNRSTQYTICNADNWLCHPTEILCNDKCELVFQVINNSNCNRNSVNEKPLDINNKQTEWITRRTAFVIHPNHVANNRLVSPVLTHTEFSVLHSCALQFGPSVPGSWSEGMDRLLNQHLYNTIGCNHSV